MNDLLQAALAVLEMLMDLDPKEGTPEFRLLKRMGHAIDQYERAKFPELTSSGRDTGLGL